MTRARSSVPLRFGAGLGAIGVAALTVTGCGFESRKTGKSGYAPACANEWERGVCEKPRIKCAEYSNCRFLPVTDEVIRWHLSGRDPEAERRD